LNLIRQTIPVVIFLILVLIFWEFCVYIFNIPEYLLPKPSVIFTKLFQSLSFLYPHIGVTALESFLGFLLGILLGTLLAIVFVHSKTLELSVYPYAIALKTVPIVAIAPLLIVWFGNGILPKVIVAAIISFFPVVVNTVKGLRSIDEEAFDLFDSLAASKWQVFIKLRIPTSLPYIFSSLRIASTLAVIGAIVGEFSGADKGLGFFILISSHRLETVDMFVGILLSSLLGITFFYAIALIEHYAVPWSRIISAEAE